jgi:hypothetical protein
MPQPLKIDQQRLLAVGHGNFNIVSTSNGARHAGQSLQTRE